MLKIRLQRTGRINAPSYRVVVVEHTESPKTGNIVEKVGTYNPTTKERNLNTDRIKYWLSVGAKATGTMHNMLVSVGVIEGKKVNVLPKKSPPKKEEEAKAEAAPAEAAPAEAKPSSAEATEGKEEVPAPELKDAPEKAAKAVAEAAGEKEE